MSAFIKELQQNKKKLIAAQWGQTDGIAKGYYFCTKLGGIETKRWFGDTFDKALSNFEKAAATWLNDANKWKYTVEYSHGENHLGYVSWGNMDISEDFI